MATGPTILGDLYVDDQGNDDEPVALLWPSLFTDHSMWRYQMPALRAAGWRTLVLDPPWSRPEARGLDRGFHDGRVCRGGSSGVGRTECSHAGGRARSLMGRHDRATHRVARAGPGSRHRFYLTPRRESATLFYRAQKYAPHQNARDWRTRQGG